MKNDQGKVVGRVGESLGKNGDQLRNDNKWKATEKTAKAKPERLY